MQYFWTIQRFFKRLKENFSPLIKDFIFDIKEIIKIPIKIFKDTKKAIKTVWLLRNLLWNEYNYDYHDALNFLEFKIKRIREHVNNHKRHVGWQRDVKNMDKALTILERIMKDEYYKETHKFVEAKWGKRVAYTECKVLNDKEYLKSKNTSRYVSLYEKENTNNSQEVWKDVKIASNAAAKLAQKDWENFWKLLSKEMRNWWC
jgi:hypothetical protein